MIGPLFKLWTCGTCWWPVSKKSIPSIFDILYPWFSSVGLPIFFPLIISFSKPPWYKTITTSTLFLIFFTSNFIVSYASINLKSIIFSFLSKFGMYCVTAAITPTLIPLFKTKILFFLKFNSFFMSITFAQITSALISFKYFDK